MLQIKSKSNKFFTPGRISSQLTGSFDDYMHTNTHTQTQARTGQSTRGKQIRQKTLLCTQKNVILIGVHNDTHIAKWTFPSSGH